MIRRSRNSGNGSKAQARMERIRDKALKLRERVKRSTALFFERRQARLAWWQRAFRTPMVAGRWIFSQARTLWAAFLALLGLKPSGRLAKLSPRVSDISAKKYRQTFTRSALMAEGLEQRQLLAVDLPVYPPVGGVALSPAPTGEVSNGGRTFSFDLNANQYAGALDKVDTLYYGLYDVKVSMAGSDNFVTMTPANLAVSGNQAIWTRNDVNLSNQTSGPYTPNLADRTGRIVLTFGDISGGSQILSGVNLPAGYAAPSGQTASGAVLAVREADKDFTATIAFEVWTGTNWVNAKSFYDPIGSGGLATSFFGGFWQEKDPVIAVAADSVADDWSLASDGTTVTIKKDGSDLFKYPNSLTNSIKINGTTDNDSLTVNLDNLPNAVEFNGGTGGSDGLTINGTGTTASVQHSFSNAHDGSVTVGFKTITYTGLEPIVDNLSASNRSFDFLGGAETIGLSVSGGNLFIDSNLAESVTFPAPVSSLTITNSGSGVDVVNLSDVGSVYTGPISVSGGDGNDDLNGSSRGGETASFTGALADYTLTFAAGDITVVDNRGGSPDGTDTVSNFEFLKFSDVTISTSAPVVIGVAVPANGTYVAGQNLDFTVSFDKDIVYSGTPQLALDIGGSPVFANAISSTSNTITFRYTVVSGDSDLDGIVVSALTGAIDDANISGNSVTNFTLTGLPSTAGILIDAVAPVATMTTSASNPTHLGTIPLSITFSEPVTGLSVSDFSVVNGAVAGLAGSGASYTINLTPAGDGTVSVTLGANSAQDAVGNGNQGPVTFSITSDQTPPTIVSITSTAPSPTNLNPIPFQVLFSESVSGLQEGEIQISNGTIVTGSLSGDGDNYSFSVVPADQGAVTVNVLGNAVYDATGPSGNKNVFDSGMAFSVVYDSVAPLIDINPIAVDDVINITEAGAAVTISGTTDAEVGQTVAVSLNSLIYYSSVAAGTPNTWSVSVPAGDVGALSNGATYTVTADVSDLAGNPATQATRDVLIDKTIPTITINDISGNNRINLAEHTQNLTISGTTDAEDGQLVSVVLNSQTYTDTASGGTWSVSVPSTAVDDLADGTTYTVTANVSDAAGNPATPASESLTVDLTPPTIAINTIAGDDKLNLAESASALTIDGTTDAEVGQTVTVMLNSASYTTAVVAGTPSNTWSVTVPATPDVAALANGNYPVTANVSDLAGNPATPASKTLMVDLTPPAKPVISSYSDNVNPVTGSGLASGTSTNDNTPTFTGTAEPNSTVELFRGAVSIGTTTASGTGAWTLTPAAQPNGPFTFTAKATDAALNVSDPSDDFDLTIDVVKPLISSVIGSGNGTYKIGDVITFTVNFSEPVSINTTGGSPQVNMFFGAGFGGTNVPMGLSSSTSTSATFSYTIQEGDLDTDGVRRRGLRSDNIINEFLQGSLIRDVAQNDLGEVATNFYFMNEDFANYLVDGVRPTVTTAVSTDTSIIASEDGNTVKLIINFSEAMDMGTNPTISFANSGATNTFTSPTGAMWNTNQQFEISYTVDDADVTLTDVVVNVSGAKDAAGNTMTAFSSSTTPVTAIDTVTPTVTITASDGTGLDIIDASETADVFFEFTEPVVPGSITVGATNGAVGPVSLVSGNKYKVTFTPQTTPGFSGTAVVTATAFSDVAGNPGVATGINLAVNTIAPSVQSVTATPTLIHDTNFTSGLDLVIIFSESMDTGVSPTVSFSTTPTGLGTPVGVWSTTNNTNDTLTLSYPFTDQGEYIPSINVSVSGAQDVASNVVIPATFNNVFGVNTAGTVLGSMLEDSGSTTVNVDIDGSGVVSFTQISGPAGTNGSLTLVGSTSVEYTPDADYFGDAVFLFELDSGLQGTATITVDPVNDVPERTAGTTANVSVGEDSGLTSLGLGGLAYGPGGGTLEAGQTLTITVTQVPAVAEIVLSDGTTVVTAGSVYTLTELQGMQVKTILDANGGPDTFEWTVVDDGGTTNGGIDTLTESLTVEVTADNDPPVAGDVTLSNVNEDNSLVITEAQLLDNSSDVDSSPLTVTAVSVQSGNGAVVPGPGVGEWTFTPDADWNGSVVLDFTVSDGSLTDDAEASFDVLPVNDPPTANDFTFAAINEDTSKVITAADLLSLSGADDIDSSPLTVSAVTLATGSGTLSGSGPWTFMPASNWNGTATFNFTVSDGSLSVTKIATLPVLAVNDAPVVNLTNSGPFSIAEDSSLTFSSGNGNQIVISDVDAVEGTGLLEVTLSVQNGVLVLPGTVGLTFSSGTGTAATTTGLASMTFQGIQSNINNALQGMQYKPTPDFNGGPSQLTVTVSDIGNFGDPAAYVSNSVPVLTDTKSLEINVTPVNDAPVLSGANDFNSITEDDVTNNGQLVSDLIAGQVSDADNPGALQGIAVTDRVNGGGSAQWQYSLDGGTTWNQFLTVSNTQSLLLRSTDRVRFVPGTLQTASAASITFRAWDQTSGTAGSKVSTTSNGGTTAFSTATAVSNITITGVNDAPTLSAPTNTTQAATEDTPKNLDLSGMLLDDVDAGAADLRLTFTANTGATWSVSGLPAGVTVGGSANVLTLDGTLTELNGVLNGTTGIVTYNPVANDNGSRTVSIVANDLGNTPSPALDSATHEITLNIGAVNDPPVNNGSLPVLGTILEDELTPIDLSSLNLDDIDSTNISVTLALSAGTLEATSGGGVTVTNSGTGSMTLSGNLAAVNAYLDNPTAISYLSAPDDNGTRTLTITLNDGIGSTVLPNIDVNITPVNDEPTFTLTSTHTSNEDAGAVTVPNIITAGSPGPANESAQTLTASVTAFDSGTLTFTTPPSISMSGGVGTLTYKAAPNSYGTAIFDVVVTDSGPNGGANGDDNTSVTKKLTITVNPVNDAPVLSGANDFTTINEDAVTNSGNLVSSLIAGKVSDVDAMPLQGIAVTAVDNGGGSKWQYALETSPSVYGAWTDVPAVSATASLLLRSVDKLRFVPNTATGTTASVTFRAWDQTGATAGQEGTTADTSTNGATTPFSADTAVSSIAVTGVNDNPTLTNPLPAAITSPQEDIQAPISLSPAQIGDVDAGSGTISLALVVATGTLHSTSTLVTVTGSGSATLNVSGTLSAINSFLSSSDLEYKGGANINGSNVDAITLYVTDNGNTGTGGGGIINLGSVPISISAVNDAPTFTVSANHTSNEDAGPQSVPGFITNGLTGPANESGQMLLPSASITQTGGSLTFDTAPSIALAFDSGSNTWKGTLSYEAAPNANGTATFEVTITDNGSGVAPNVNTSVTKTFEIVVNPVNDAPVLSGANDFASITEDATSNAGDLVSDLIDTVSDVDAGALTGIAVTSTADGNGSWEFSTDAGANWSAVGTVSGTSSLLLRSEDKLRFVPNGVSATTASVTFRAWDQTGTTSGQQGTKVSTSTNGGTTPFSTAEATSEITVTDVNDAPTFTGSLPPSITVYEEITTGVDLSAIVLSDVDTAGSVDNKLTLTTVTGAISIVVPGSLTTISVGGNAQARVVTGSLADINALLATVGSIQYTGELNVVGPSVDSISVTYSDEGNTGSTSESVFLGSISVSVLGANDAPVVTLPTGPFSTSEDTTTPMVITGISVNDVDAGTSPIMMTFSVLNGKLSFVGTVPGTLTASAGGAASITLSGPQGDLNGYLSSNGISYLPNLNFNTVDTAAVETLTVKANDGGATGVAPFADALEDTKSLNISVSEVNDAPTTTTLNIGTNEDTAKVQSVITGVLPGGASNSFENGQTISLIGGTSPSHGTVGFNFGAGTITYTPTANYYGPDSFTVTLRDNGTTGGSNNFKTVVRTISVSVTAINDAPTNVSTATPVTNQSVDEDTATALDLSWIELADVDVNDGTGILAVTLSTTNGGVLTANEVSGITVTGSGGSSIEIQGTLTALNAFLPNSVEYQGPANAFGADYDIVSVSVSDLGNFPGPTAGVLNIPSLTISIDAVNDEPENVGNTPADHQAVEETASTVDLSDIDLQDVDLTPPTTSMDLKLETSNGGVLTLSATFAADHPDVSFSGDGSTSLILTGTVADLNAVLDDTSAISYTGDTDVFGDDADTITISGKDDVMTTFAVIDTVNVDIAGVNDAPIVNGVVAQSTLEDMPKTITGISVGDVDVSATDVLRFSVSVNHGKIDLATLAGLTLVSGGDGTASMTYDGTLSNINSALASLTYTPNDDYNGNDSLTVAIDDLGNVGTPGALTDSESAIIAVSAINDKPTLTNPGPQSINENDTLTFSTSGSNALVVGDIDVAASGPLQLEVTLTVGSGTLNLASLSGITIMSGSNGSSTVTFRGIVDDLNAALDGLTYTPPLNATGTFYLNATVNDLGNTGIFITPLTSTEVVSILVDDVNTAPIVTDDLPSSISGDEDQSINVTFGASSISDPDVGGADLHLTLSATAGTLSFSSFTGVDPVGPTSGSTITVKGTLSELNSLLANPAGSITYKGPQDANNLNLASAPEITVSVDDLGVGGVTAFPTAIEIDLAPVNDVPVITAPATASVSEDGSLAFTGSNLLDVDDLDINEDGTGELTVMLAATNGSLAVDTTGLTSSSVLGGNATLTGTLTAVKAALATVVYMPTPDYNGSATLTIDADDAGNTGSGATSAVQKIVNITVTSVGDAPELVVPAGQTISEDTVLVFSTTNGNAITVDDVDSPTLTVSLSVSNGRLTLISTSGLSFTVGDGTFDPAMTFSGTPSAINAAMEGLLYQPNINFNEGLGSESLAVTVSDGGSLSDSGSVPIAVVAVNDDPANVGGVPGTITAIEDQASDVDLSALDLVDVDLVGASASLPVTVRLTTTSGGALTASGAGVTVGGSGSQITLTGSLADLNALLNNASAIQFTGANDANGTGADAITMEVRDNGNIGSGGDSWIPLGNVVVDIDAVNDHPTFDVLVGHTSDENDGPQSVPNFLTNASPGPADEAGQTPLTISIENNTNPGLFASGPSIAANGTLTYEADVDAFGTATITVRVTDTGGTANGGVDFFEKTFVITVNAVNSAPVVTAPATDSTDEDVPLTFSSTNGNSIVISDVDSPNVSVVLEVLNGTLFATASGSASVTNNGQASITVAGSKTDVNATLNGLVYTPDALYYGTDTLTITATDNGAPAGVGAAVVGLDVDPVNNPPVLTLPTAPVSLVENTWITLKDVPVSVTDVDSDPGDLTLTFELSSGEFQVLPGPIQGSINLISSTKVEIQGTVAEINDDASGTLLAALKMVRFKLADSDPGAGAQTTVTMAVSVTDNFNTGPIEGLDSGTVTFHVTDGAPTITLSGSLSHDESSTTPYVLSLGAVSDIAGLVADPIVAGIIYWGDGTSTNLTAGQIADLNSGTVPFTVSHLYEDDEDVLLPIRVDLLSQGNDTVFQSAGSLNLTVNNVVPTGSVAVNGPFNEGDTGGLVSVINIVEPSNPDLAELLFSYDFNNDGSFEIIDSPNSQVAIPDSFLADNLPALLPNKEIRVVIKDDGGQNSYVVPVVINNVTPTVAPLTDNSTQVNQLYTRNVTFTDPGADVWTAVVNFGDGSTPVTYSNVGKTFTISHTYTLVGTYTVNVTVTDDDGASDSESFDVEVTAVPASIAGRHIFYNRSVFDGTPIGSATDGGNDDAAIATDKSALLPIPGNSAGFANYTNYIYGINGIMIDVANLGSAAITAADFEFRVGNTNNPATWPLLTTQPTIEVRQGDGTGGSDRIELTWPDGTITNKWLQVTVKANLNTGLVAPDVHYWGNQIGETHNQAGNTAVNNGDLFAVFGGFTSAGSPAGIANPLDVNRDDRVNNTDLFAIFGNFTSAGDSLVLLSFTSPLGGGEGEGSGALGQAGGYSQVVDQVFNEEEDEDGSDGLGVFGL